MFEQAIIISVDESNFKSDSLPNRQWQFKAQLGKRKRPLVIKKGVNILQAIDDHIEIPCKQ